MVLTMATGSGDVCGSISLSILSIILLAIFGFGFYSFVRTCQQEAQKRLDQCLIVNVFEQEGKCKGNVACWSIYVTMDYPKANPMLYQYALYTTKIDADNALSSLQNRTTVECMITPCFIATSENGNDPNRCIYMPGTNFGGWIVLSLMFGVIAAGTLAIVVTVLTIGMICKQAGCISGDSKYRKCCKRC